MTAPGVCWLFAGSYSIDVKDSANSPTYTSFAEIANKTYWNLSDASGVTLNSTVCGSNEMAQLRSRINGYNVKLTEMNGYP